MKTLLERILAALASLKVTVVGLLLLMVLTIWGTLYQAEHGLYQAQERFYQSWFLWIWNLIPFPGAQTVMTVLFVNLGASVAYMALRRKLSVGFVTTHLGLALLLAAGGVTFYTGREAQLSLEEGEASNVAVSMRDWELAVVPAMPQPKRTVLALSTKDIRTGRSIPMPDGKTTIRVEQFFDNCAAEKADVQNPPQSGSGATVLHRQPAAREPSDNYPGAILVLESAGKVLARILVWGGDGVPAIVDLPDGSRAMGLRRERLPLPASIELVDFIRELHPGTGIARSYSSDVMVRTGGEMKRKVHVAMNKPLRLHDFTFYQSSFGNAPGGRETSTFSVVQNSGRVIPYVATGLTGAGMIVHFSGILIARLRRNRREAVS